MRYTLAHRGIPLGALDLPEGEFAGIVTLDPTAEWVRDLAAHGYESLANLGFLGSVDDEGNRRGRAALDAWRDLSKALELIADDGARLPAAVTLWALGGGRVVQAHVHLDEREGGAPVGARRLGRGPRRDADASQPAA